MHSYPHPLPDPVIVVGAGCIGLSTAVRLLEAGHPVLILADHLPSDPLDARYASTAAGAHHLSFADNGDWRQRFLDQRTFDILWQESENAEQGLNRGLMRLTQTEFYDGNEKHIRFLEQLPDFRVLPADSIPDFATHSCSFTSLTIEPSRYMPYLVQRMSALGGVMARVPRLADLASASKYSRSRPRAIVNCTGLGSIHLGDVKDDTVHPVRGQVLCLNAPWVRSGWTRQVGSLAGGEGGERTYVIPRASGEVIIGGTREKDDWVGKPRQETSTNIIRRALEICPQLAYPPVSSSSASDPAAPHDLKKLIKGTVVGFRPTRDAGIRLEVDKQKTSAGVPIIHNYGHGGYGWQCSWGCAEEVQRLVGEVTRSSNADEIIQTGGRVSKL